MDEEYIPASKKKQKGETYKPLGKAFDPYAEDVELAYGYPGR